MLEYGEKDTNNNTTKPHLMNQLHWQRFSLFANKQYMSPTQLYRSVFFKLPFWQNLVKEIDNDLVFDMLYCGGFNISS